ncbi:MAG: hypothetical protein ACI92I_000153 [Acidimicrobiales bacterium]|jgi:hypothetical protein
MAYPELKKQAIKLRKKGYSYNLISEKIGVSKSTLHYWLTEIPYTANAEVQKRIGKARARSGEVKHQIKLETFRKAKALAIDDIGSLNGRDLFMLGLGIYIGEGEKNENIGVINADPRIVVLLMRWFKEVCSLENSNFTLAIHLYPDNDIEESLTYWSGITDIPRSQFGKTQIDKRENKSINKRGKLPHGTAHLRVKSNGKKEFGVLLSRRIHAWMNLVLTNQI